MQMFFPIGLVEWGNNLVEQVVDMTTSGVGERSWRALALEVEKTWFRCFGSQRKFLLYGYLVVNNTQSGYYPHLFLHLHITYHNHYPLHSFLYLCL